MISLPQCSDDIGALSARLADAERERDRLAADLRRAIDTIDRLLEQHQRYRVLLADRLRHPEAA